MGCTSSKGQHDAVLDVPKPGADGAEYDAQEYEDLLYLARVRAVKLTVNKSTQAGLMAGLCVMAGVLVAGPVGAAAGGAVGTAVAVRHSQGVLTLTELLRNTPPHQRGEVCRIFGQALKEEFDDTVQNNPELRLILAGASPVHVARYLVEKDIIESEGLKRLDAVLSKIS